jgi:5-methylcytosine-specific restriction endonuclease McrA
MSYKYPAVKTLSRMIARGEVAEDIDIKALIKKAGQYEKYIYPKRIKKYPRFYFRAISANARAKKMGAEGRVTADDLEEVYAKFGGKCANCGATEHLVFDHIISYFNKGTNTKDNLQLLCRICNMLKGAN